jgi:hypothetical protein
MPKQPLRKIIGVLGDRARVQNDNGSTEEVWLLVNGGGQVLALTQEQLSLHGMEPIPEQAEQAGTGDS